MTAPGVDLDPLDLRGHAYRSQSRADDYPTPYPPDVPQDGWPSQQAYDRAHKSMADAGGVFADRQRKRGDAVNGAADGFTGQDFDAAKMLQGVGAMVGPAVQGATSGLAPATQMLSAGAQMLSGMLQAGVGLTRNTPAVATGAGAGAGLAGGLGGGGTEPVSASTPPRGAIGHSGPPRDGRPAGGQEPKVVNIGVTPGMGMGGMPMGRSTEGRHAKPATAKVEDAPITEPIPIPVTARPQIREA
jgi:hypothetical protein